MIKILSIAVAVLVAFILALLFSFMVAIELLFEVFGR
jgi:hypothetical protein